MTSVFTLRDIIIHVLFFLNSFIPLWIILLVQVIFFEPDLNKFQFYIATGIFIGMIIIPTVFVYLFIRNTEKTTGTIKVKIIKNNDLTGEYAIYLITYIIAFISGDFFTEKQIVTFGIIFAFFGIIYVKNHMFHINPFITMLGFKFHRAYTEVDNDVNILSRKASLFNQEIRMNKITRGFYIETSD